MRWSCDLGRWGDAGAERQRLLAEHMGNQYVADGFEVEAGGGDLAGDFGEWKTDPPLDRLLADPVICARKNHFFNPPTQQFEMFGFVRVLPGNGQ